MIVLILEPDRAIGGKAGGLGTGQPVFRVPCVIPLSEVRHVAVSIIRHGNGRRDGGVLVKAVSSVAVGDGVER